MATKGRTVALVAAVVMAATALVGSGQHHGAGPAEAAQTATAQTTTAPVSAPASSAQPTAPVLRGLRAQIPFYWRTFRNWDGSLCVGLYSDNGQPTPIYYCY